MFSLLVSQGLNLHVYSAVYFRSLKSFKTFLCQMHASWIQIFKSSVFALKFTSRQPKLFVARKCTFGKRRDCLWNTKFYFNLSDLQFWRFYNCAKILRKKTISIIAEGDAIYSVGFANIDTNLRFGNIISVHFMQVCNQFLFSYLINRQTYSSFLEAI